MSEKQTIIVIHETTLQSIARDAVTLATGIAFIGLGWFVGSAAMEWTGAVMFFISIFIRASGKLDESKFTPQEAVNFLRDEFGVVADR